MGLPIQSFLSGVNVNDSIYRFVQSGKLEPSTQVVVTNSPAMDIQVPYNLERVFYFLSGQDSEKVSQWMKELYKKDSKGLDLSFGIGKNVWEQFKKLYLSERATPKETSETISRWCVKTNGKYVLDPHTAVAVCGVEKVMEKKDENLAKIVVILATAHPAKFSKEVEQATKGRAHVEIPKQLDGIREKNARSLFFGKDENWTSKLRSLIENTLVL